LEEVSGFVVVTKQNYFRPIRKKLQNQTQQKRSSEQEMYCVEDQKDGEQNHPKLPAMRTQTGVSITDKCTGTSVGDKTQLHICEEKENETILVRQNEVYNSDFGKQSAVYQHSEGAPNKSQALRTLPHRNYIGGRRKDECVHKQDKEMQKIPEGCVEELISPVKQSTVFSSRGKICANDYIREPYVRALDSKGDAMKLDKIEAIEGWMKIYENEFFNERNKAIDNEGTGSSVAEAMELSATVPLQGPHVSVSHPTILLDTREKAAEPAGIQTSANLFPSYVDVLCAKQRQCLSQTVPEFFGSHPRSEKAKKSPSINMSQQRLDSSKHFSDETLEEMQLNQQKCGSTGKEELPFARTHHTEGQSIPPKVVQEYICEEKQNWNAKSDLPENNYLMASNNKERMNCPMQSNNANVEGVSIEPICEAVRVIHQETDSFQFKSRSGFKRCPPEAGSKATLEQIEAMIEPKTEEQPSREQTLKQREARRTGAKPEPIRASCHSLMPDIVKVKLAIDNQSKILDRLDLMIKHNEITNWGTYKTEDTHAALVPRSEVLTSLHESESEVGAGNFVSCRPFGSLSSSSSLKNVTDSELSGIPVARNPHTQCSSMSAVKHMTDGRIIGERLHGSPQCPSVQTFAAGHNGRSGYRVLTGHSVGEYCSFSAFLARHTLTEGSYILFMSKRTDTVSWLIATESSGIYCLTQYHL
jgi:hypothetical protein